MTMRAFEHRTAYVTLIMAPTVTTIGVARGVGYHPQVLSGEAPVEWAHSIFNLNQCTQLLMTRLNNFQELSTEDM